MLISVYRGLRGVTFTILTLPFQVIKLPSCPLGFYEPIGCQYFPQTMKTHIIDKVLVFVKNNVKNFGARQKMVCIVPVAGFEPLEQLLFPAGVDLQ
jgi:hypothetical protein